jgi:regulator of protease activity HflC (stomatin/prohibitin superfamily)
MSGFDENTAGFTVKASGLFLRLIVWFSCALVLGGATFLAYSLVPPLNSSVVLISGLLLSVLLATMVGLSVHLVPEYERLVVLRKGKFVGVRGPGLFWVFPYPPFFETVAASVDTRVETVKISNTKTLTFDKVPVTCKTAVQLLVIDPRTAVLGVRDYRNAAIQLATSVVKDTIGEVELTELLGERHLVSKRLKEVISGEVKAFGLEAASVDLTDVIVPDALVEELSVRAQSRRSLQAKVSEAKIEKDVAQTLQAAASSMGPKAMEMYRLKVLERVAREPGNQIVIYGMGGSDLEMDKDLAAAASGNSVFLKK